MEENNVRSFEYFKDMDLQYAFDGLTKVLGREYIIGFAHHLIKEKTPFTLCLCDIDNFKNVNDFYGHMVGDDVLVGFSKELIRTIGNKGVIGRYGGDEFMVILPNINDYDTVWDVCHAINVNVAKLTFEAIPDLNITLTTGISRYPIDALSYDELLLTSDKALYRGKSKGRNCFIIYLASKHENIEIKERTDTIFNTMEMISKLFDIAESKRDVLVNIQKIVQYLSTYLAVDYISLEADNEVVFSCVHPQSEKKDFGIIEKDLLKEQMNSIGLVYVNSRRNIMEVHSSKLFKRMKETEVYSLAATRVDMYGIDYGILVIKSINTRIWQLNELDLIIIATRLISMILNQNGITLKDMKRNKN